MDLTHTFANLADRAEASVDSLPDLTEAQLNAHPLGHPNSIAWLLWHAGRVLDQHTAMLSGEEQKWTLEGFAEKFGLGEAGNAVGVGHTPEEAAAIKVADRELLVAYVKATLGFFRDYVSSLEKEEAFDELIGEFKGAPDTRQARLTLIIVDALRHIDQALYVAGMPELGE